jgi:hypothetical protein
MNRFDYDNFLSLLLRYMDRQVSRSERQYVERALKESEDARQLMKDVKDSLSWDISSLLPEGHSLPGKKLHRKRAPAYSRLFVCCGILAIVIGGLLFNMYPGLWGPYKKAEKELQITEAPNESSQRPRISLGAEAEIISENGYTRIISKPDLTVNKWHYVIVPRGCTFRIKLPDDTKVQLNADSKLRFPANFSSTNREVYLEGEAYFELSPDSSSMFVVHTRHGDLTSHATTFNVEAYPDEDQCVVSVISGSVAVTKKPQKTVSLKAGQALTIAGNEPNFHITSFDAAVITSRLEGKYFFFSKNIVDICRLIERVYNTTIVIDRSEINRNHFSGAFSSDLPVEIILEDLSGTGFVSYYRDSKGRWHLK